MNQLKNMVCSPLKRWTFDSRSYSFSRTSRYFFTLVSIYSCLHLRIILLYYGSGRGLCGPVNDRVLFRWPAIPLQPPGKQPDQCLRTGRLANRLKRSGRKLLRYSIQVECKGQDYQADYRSSDINQDYSTAPVFAQHCRHSFLEFLVIYQ